jgi:O-antigen ligase
MAAAALAALLMLSPFEPRAPLVRVAGMGLTVLELAAAATAAVLLLAGRDRLGALLRRPALPLACLGAYAAAHVLSALCAPGPRDAPLRFALRMSAMAAVAAAIALAPPEAVRRGLRALGLIACLVAVLAVAEVAGLPLDAWLDRFRDTAAVVGAQRRATAGSAHPNLAGAFLAYGLVAGTAVISGRARALRGVVPLAALLTLGLLATYSRGALLAAACGLLALALRTRRAAAWAALAVLVVGGAAALLAPAVRLRAGGEGTVSWYAVRCRPDDERLVLRPGEQREVTITVENTGRMPWQAGRGFMAAYKLRNLDRGTEAGEGFGPWLDEDVAPGATRRLSLPLQAPRTPGRYVLAWDMVHVHAGWFSQHGSPPAWVRLDVSPDGAPLRDDDFTPPHTLVMAPPPGRPELWDAALTLWRQRPLLGVGPDNFRRLYGGVLGDASADPRTYANNTLLEALATTGLLGAAALVATFLALLASAARSRAPESAALLALGTVLAVHGLVDYVLAFNGHALVLAFVVGALSRPHLPPRASS